MEHGHGPTSDQLRGRPPWGTTGIRGVYPAGNGRFTARFRLDGKLMSCGTFDTIAEAEHAVKMAEEASLGLRPDTFAHRPTTLEQTRNRVLDAWNAILGSGEEPTIAAMSRLLPDLSYTTIYRHRRDLSGLGLIEFDVKASTFAPGNPAECGTESARDLIESRTDEMRKLKADRGERRAGSWSLPEVRDPRRDVR